MYRITRGKIIFTYVFPPIPVRDFDWSAQYDGYEPGDPLGHGASCDEAQADLEQQLAERNEDVASLPI